MSLKISKRKQIFLVDDHTMVREGLAVVLTQAGFEICGQAASISETLAHPGLIFAHLAVIDLSLGEDSGLTLIKALADRKLSLLVYSMHEDAYYIQSAFSAGALGYVTKREVSSSLVEAVTQTLMGCRYLSPRAALTLLNVPKKPTETKSATSFPSTDFSEQQQRLYRLLGEGLDTDEIATKLGISPRTVESYCARMIEKLNLSGMKELRKQAITYRLQQPL